MIESKNGFTIVETMIFLAITGAAFFMAVTILGSQQRSTQFSQAVSDFESSLNDISNDTETGVFTDIRNVKCNASSKNNTGVITFTVVEDTEPGENNDCIFVGSVVQLVDNKSDDSDYTVHTLVGINNSNARNFIETRPIPLHSDSDSISGLGAADFGDAGTKNLSLPWGAKITKAYYEDPVTNIPIYIRGIAYVYSNFGNRITEKDFTSGSASVGLYTVEAPANAEDITNSIKSIADFRKSINSQIPGDSIYKSVKEKVTICLEGVGGRKSMMEVGSESGSIAARSNYDVSEVCKN